MGPKTPARTAPNTYRINLPAVWNIFDEFNVERLRPYLRWPACPDGAAWVGPDGLPAVQELLKFKVRWGRPFVLIRFTRRATRGRLGAARQPDGQRGGHRRLRASHRPHLAPARRAGARRSAVADPTGSEFTVDPAPPTDLGAALVGRSLLYWWPHNGWQRGTVARARLCPRAAISHVVAYRDTPLADVGAAVPVQYTTRPTRCSTPPRTAPLFPAPAAGVQVVIQLVKARALRPRPPGLQLELEVDVQFGRCQWLVTVTVTAGADRRRCRPASRPRVRGQARASEEATNGDPARAAIGKVIDANTRRNLAATGKRSTVRENKSLCCRRPDSQADSSRIQRGVKKRFRHERLPRTRFR